MQDTLLHSGEADELARSAESLTWWRRTRRSRSRAIVHILLIFVCLMMALPLFYTMLIATQTPAEVFSYPPKLTPGNQLMSNLQKIWNSEGLAQSMIFTTQVALIVVVGKTILAMFAGMAFVYFRFPLRGLLFYIILFTMMLPTEVILLALFRIVSSMEMTSNPWLVLTIPFLGSATGTFLYQQHFLSIPTEMVDAAQIDGAGPLRFLWSVLIPLSWNVTAALAVIQFVYVWNQYLWPLVVARGDEISMVQLELGQLVTGDHGFKDYGPIMTGAIIASLPPLLVFVLLQKRFLQGFGFSRDK